jgi:hypothetical protein
LAVAVKLVTLGFAAALVCCKVSNPPSMNATAVYNELVDAGCMAPDDGGATAVAQELALGDAADPWLTCLFGGGTVASCNVPCSAVSTKLKK